MNDRVAASYDYCADAAKRAASNFYYTFALLPHEKRRAMYVVYAYLRELDDLVDEFSPATVPFESTQSLDFSTLAAERFWSAPDEATLRREPRWRRLIAARDAFDRALAGEPSGPILPAVADVVRRFAIPPEHFHAVMNGAAMDLAGRIYRTPDETDDYCHHVAVVVGFICLRIWGFRDERAFAPARACGLAFQRTNILRDLGEDAAAGRMYLSEDALRTAGYDLDRMLHGVEDEAFDALMRVEVARTEALFDEAASLVEFLDRDGATIFAAMFSTYRELLGEIARDPGAVLHRRVRVSRWRKFIILARAWWSGGTLPPPHIGVASSRASPRTTVGS